MSLCRCRGVDSENTVFCDGKYVCATRKNENDDAGGDRVMVVVVVLMEVLVKWKRKIINSGKIRGESFKVLLHVFVVVVLLVLRLHHLRRHYIHLVFGGQSVSPWLEWLEMWLSDGFGLTNKCINLDMSTADLIHITCHQNQNLFRPKRTSFGHRHSTGSDRWSKLNYSQRSGGGRLQAAAPCICMPVRRGILCVQESVNCSGWMDRRVGVGTKEKETMRELESLHTTNKTFWFLFVFFSWL